MSFEHAVMWLIGLLLTTVVGLLVLETLTLKDDVPGNHITAIVRGAVSKQPGPFFMLMFALGFLFGHLFWP